MSERRVVFEGRIVRVTVEELTMPDGARLPFEIVHHPGGAAIVALDEAQRVCLLRQYRPVTGDWLWEIPAGKLDAAPLATAQRELQEEAGLLAGHWTSLGMMHSSPGIFSEVVHLYLARELSATARAPEPGEVMEVHWQPLAELVAWALDGRISDAKTIIALLRTRALLAGT